MTSHHDLSTLKPSPGTGDAVGILALGFGRVTAKGDGCEPVRTRSKCDEVIGLVVYKYELFICR